MNDEKNSKLYEEYKYYDVDQVIAEVLDLTEKELQ